MIFEHSRGGAFKIGDDARAVIRSYEQHAPEATEAGGLLLGRYIRDGWDIVVDRVTVPMPGDRRTRFGFFRAADAHNRVLHEAWESSGGTCCWLGDWHTHAEPDPTPSQVDLDNWRAMRADAHHGSAVFAVIVGQRSIRVWDINSEGIAVPCEPRNRRAA